MDACKKCGLVLINGKCLDCDVVLNTLTIVEQSDRTLTVLNNFEAWLNKYTEEHVYLNPGDIVRMMETCVSALKEYYNGS